MTNLEAYKLSLFERCEAGDITEEERDVLLESVCEEADDEMDEYGESVIDRLIDGYITEEEASLLLEGRINAKDVAVFGKKVDSSTVLRDYNRKKKEAEEKAKAEHKEKMRQKYEQAASDKDKRTVNKYYQTLREQGLSEHDAKSKCYKKLRELQQDRRIREKAKETKKAADLARRKQERDDWNKKNILPDNTVFSDSLDNVPAHLRDFRHNGSIKGTKL